MFDNKSKNDQTTMNPTYISDRTLGDVSSLRSQIDKGLSLDDIRANNNWVFRTVCKRGKFDVCRYIISLGLSLDDIRSEDNDAFQLACKNGNLNIVKYLVSFGLNIDDIRSNNNEALRLACHSGYLNIVRYLISQGITLDDIRSCNNAALRGACENRHIDIVEYLIEQGLSRNDIRDRDIENLQAHGMTFDIKEYFERSIPVTKEYGLFEYLARNAVNNNNLEMLTYVTEHKQEYMDQQSIDSRIQQLVEPIDSIDEF